MGQPPLGARPPGRGRRASSPPTSSTPAGTARTSRARRRSSGSRRRSLRLGRWPTPAASGRRTGTGHGRPARRPRGRRVRRGRLPPRRGRELLWGHPMSAEHRAALLAMVVEVHAAPAAVRDLAPVDDYAIPHRDQLEAALRGGGGSGGGPARPGRTPRRSRAWWPTTRPPCGPRWRRTTRWSPVPGSPPTPPSSSPTASRIPATRCAPPTAGA